MPGKKDAWREAKRLRDAEFQVRDAEIKKWEALIDQVTQLTQAGDTDAANAKFVELLKQADVVAECLAVIDGKLEAMDALQAADTKSRARNAIKRLIRDESREFYNLLAEIFPGFPGGALGPNILDVLERDRYRFVLLRAIALQIEGKKEIAKIVETHW